MMKNPRAFLLCTFMLTMAVFSVRAQVKPYKILFIGNSFTYNNSLPEIVNRMAKAAGFKTEIASYIALGQSVDYFIHDTACWHKIKSRPWDYIVIQDNQRYYYDSVGKIDSFGHPMPLLANNIRLQNDIKKLIPCVKIIYFAGWEQNGGVPSLFPKDNTIAMLHRILGNYNYMNNMRGVHNVIAPIGVAWIKCLRKRPYLGDISYGKYLFDNDGRHPGSGGTYITALVLFGTIFHQSPLFNPDRNAYFYGQETDTFLRKAAWAAIQDSFVYTNLGSVSPGIDINKNMISTSKRYQTYQWYSDTFLLEGQNKPTYEATTITGNYWVETTDNYGCRYKSFPVNVKPEAFIKKKRKRFFATLFH